MRTRRSPRNQEILWRELGGPTPNRKPERILTEAEIDALPISNPAKAAERRHQTALRMRRARHA